ncbi:MAG: primosomal protein N' [Lachnospiraceae bacterium]|nr:primosomal protein N' [Lachnospiraceae bacterium]
MEEERRIKKGDAVIGSYAAVILKQKSLRLDRVFDYRIPDRLRESVRVGSLLRVPFGTGNTEREGYCVDILEETEIPAERLKDVLGVSENAVPAEAEMIRMAAWLRQRYGSTMIQALMTCLPVREKVRKVVTRTWVPAVPEEQLRSLQEETAGRGNQKARLRLLDAVLLLGYIDEAAMDAYDISQAVLKHFTDQGILCLEEEEVSRDPYATVTGQEYAEPPLSERQREAADGIEAKLLEKPGSACYLCGVTGSGKTLVYTELIARTVARGQQAIFLIPEIALTYQTVQRFRARFGDRVSVLHSRLSAGERFDQFERAARGEIDVMVGPRSALFTPFPSLGLIVMDEEHEDSYKSETSPCYHAREAAAWRARDCGAGFVLGSATPSVEAYKSIRSGDVAYFTLPERARAGSRPPEVRIIDMREEMKRGNKSIFSEELASLMEERLERREQILLFLNRRGYAGALTCRACGEVIKCPHCDVSLTLHGKTRLLCHYCGYTRPVPSECPSCGSPYIAAFGIGTQKVEEAVRAMFPSARTLRMDLDTTSGKGGHDRILRAFGAGEADILIGTQMIVKGHDFPRVTLVGIVAADLSLSMPDHRAAEKTYQLLVQAAGRAGRAERPGTAVIQTYQPEHFCIRAAAAGDYDAFYREEEAYRLLMKYPPFFRMVTVTFASKSEAECSAYASDAAAFLASQNARLAPEKAFLLIGPAQPPVAKRKDVYYRTVCAKGSSLQTAVWLKDSLTAWALSRKEKVSIQFDIR